MKDRAAACQPRHGWTAHGPYVVCGHCSRALDLRACPPWQTKAVLSGLADADRAEADAALAAWQAGEAQAGGVRCPTCGRAG